MEGDLNNSKFVYLFFFHSLEERERRGREGRTGRALIGCDRLYKCWSLSIGIFTCFISTFSVLLVSYKAGEEKGREEVKEN